jgi:hypothetical protein
MMSLQAALWSTLNKPKGEMTCLLNKCICLYQVLKREFGIVSEKRLTF